MLAAQNRKLLPLSHTFIDQAVKLLPLSHTFIDQAVKHKKTIKN